MASPTTSEHTNRAPRPRFLHNQRQALANAVLRQSGIYPRMFSQYGENAVDSFCGVGGWTFGDKV